MIASNEKLLLSLIKMALGKSAECALPDALEWSTLFGLSVKQCVPSVVLDGLNKSFHHLQSTSSKVEMLD